MSLNFLLVGRCSLLFVRCSLLFARCLLHFPRFSLLFACCSLLFLSFYEQLSNCLTTRVTLIYLIDEFFTFSFLLLLKQMRTRGESKISSCCFFVSCKSRELGGRRSKIPSCNPSGEKFLRPTSSYNRFLGRVAFKILSTIHNGALSWKYPTALTFWSFQQKSSTAVIHPDSECEVSK